MKIGDCLVKAGKQLRSVGSFNLDKLDDSERSFLMRIERIFEDVYNSDFSAFIKDAVIVAQNAKGNGEDPEQALFDWIQSDIDVLRFDARLAKSKLH